MPSVELIKVIDQEKPNENNLKSSSLAVQVELNRAFEIFDNSLFTCPVV